MRKAVVFAFSSMNGLWTMPKLSLPAVALTSNTASSPVYLLQLAARQ